MVVYSKLAENRPPPALPLDASLFRPNLREWDFLRSTISTDDAEIKRRVVQIQRECVFAT